MSRKGFDPRKILANAPVDFMSPLERPARLLLNPLPARDSACPRFQISLESDGPWSFFVRALMAWSFLIGAMLVHAQTNSDLMQRIPPRPPREFRGAWIATVANVDWPSKPGLTTAQQQAELLALLDKAVALKLNVLIFQVRPACDSFYASTLEPWSEFLSGQMGKAPDPFYDPLTFAVNEAHRRGLELHAWFNPFRVRSPVYKSGAATNYMTLSHPSWVRAYGGQLWLDPGLREVRDYSTRVILDVVRRYDVDGIHLDDYFYPYPEKNVAGALMDFPDESTWKRFLAAGGKLAREDWRRRNVDEFVENLYRQVKAEKKWVKVGISPFGIWRPGFPKQIRGLDAYDRLYADARKWLMQGWVDYLAPQLYWGIDQPDRSFSALLEWWAGQNPKARHLWPGSNATKVGEEWTPSEIVRQVKITRRQAGATGNILWSISSLNRNNGRLADALAKEVFTQPSLVPASPWLDGRIPGKPQVRLEHSAGSNTNSKVAWLNTGGETPWLWLVQARIKGRWATAIYPSLRGSALLPNRKSNDYPELVAVTAINRSGLAGPTAVLDLPGTADAFSEAKQQR